MLTPEYLNSCTDYLLGMYDQLQTEICCDIARKLVKTGRLTDSAWIQAKRVQQSGKLMEDVISYVASIANLSEAEVKRMFNEAGLKNIECDSAPLRNAGIDVDLKLSPAMQQVLKANIQKTNGDNNDNKRSRPNAIHGCREHGAHEGCVWRLFLFSCHC